MTKQLPRLEELIVTSGRKKNEVDFILDSLRNTKDLCFQETLKSLKMSSSNIDQKSFGTLWFEIRPRFLDLVTLDLGYNRIESIRPITTIVKSDSNYFVSKPFRVLVLCCNPTFISPELRMYHICSNVYSYYK